MKPPYDVSTEILNYIASISEKLGEVKANYLNKPSPQLRKYNKIRTIHSSLSIEGNILSEEQITAILDNKRVIAPQKDINEVLNANNVYDNISKFNPISTKSFLEAHKFLLDVFICFSYNPSTNRMLFVHWHLTPQLFLFHYK